MKSYNKLILTFSASIFVVLFLLPSCGPSYIEQGEITFDITYPYNPDLSATMKMVLPKEATLIFKESKMLTVVKTGKIFKTEIYADEALKELEMRLDFGSDDFFTLLNDTDQKDFLASQPHYTITPTADADSLKGLWAKKYKVKYDSDTIPEFESWFTEALTLQAITWFSNYQSVKGVPLIYDIDQHGIRMHFEISGFKKREIDDKEFTRDPVLKEIPYKEYDRKLHELFEVILS
jgi:hypothetical protein